MTLIFRPATAEEYAAYRAETEVDYARQMVEHGGMDPEVAREKSETDVAALMPPEGPLSTHRVTVADEHGQKVGILWIGPSRMDPKNAWVFYVGVDEQHRGRGFGRQLMLEAERAALEDGYGSIGLNVFGGNSSAIALYDSLGYQVAAQEMSKSLTDD